jgi:hypothetical protein
MNRLISPGEFRLGLRLILKQPILSLTVILAGRHRHRGGDHWIHVS